MRYLLFVVLTACGSLETPAAEPQQVSFMNPGEEWVGRYVCAQGETDLDLHINRVAGDTVDATFEFSHGPSGAGGAYRMRGNITPSGQVTLVPGPWIDRPANYFSVGMHGDIQGSRFVGRIDSSACTDFDLRRR